MCNYDSILVTLFWRPQMVHFGPQKKLKKRHQVLKKLFYEHLEYSWHYDLYFWAIRTIFLAS